MEANNTSCDHKHQYSCVQYNLPSAVANKIIQWGRDHISDHVLYEPPDDAAYGREDTIHCTVFFGLHTPSALPVIYLLENESPFLIRLGQTSFFSNSKFDVVTIAAYSDDLIRLHNKIGTCLKCTETYNYIPHITIAYVQKGTGSQFACDRTFDRLTVRAETLQFSSKNGQRSRIHLQPVRPQLIFF